MSPQEPQSPGPANPGNAKPPADPPLFGRSAPKRTVPMLCAYSGNLSRVPYADIGNVAGQIGYEGIDLTVMIGGHVDPRITNVDLIRAFESIRGSSLEVPMISTNIVSAGEGTTYAVLYLTGHSQIPLFRLGYFPYGEVNIRQRLLQVRMEVAQIVSLGQRCEIAAMFPNRAGGFVGQSTWDAQEILGAIDPSWAGYYFDPAEATAEGGLGGWETALRLALPRLKAISLQDFYWAKDGADWNIRKCPLGEGMVDWDRFFALVAASRFAGPISIHMEYRPQDVLGSMAKDLEFARARVERAWAAILPAPAAN